ncbi:MAG: ABC transporter ATP-binding protein [Clostridiaceae bacterium]|nr:ABC transporter ATP-binding protein [Clostridiaceae bacterium]
MEQPAIRTQNLCKTYQMGQTPVEALADVTLEIFPGEFVSIMGKSGSGKSTLLHLMGGLDRQTAGSVWIGDQEISEMPESRLSVFRRQHLGFVFQFFNLIPELTLWENIVFPSLLENNTYDREVFAELCDTLELRGRLIHRPSQVSGGQQQRAAIARALILRPDVILLDEPTGNLDQSSADAVLRLLRTVSERWHQTVVLVTHDEEAAAYGDRVIRLTDGRLA